MWSFLPSDQQLALGYYYGVLLYDHSDVGY